MQRPSSASVGCGLVNTFTPRRCRWSGGRLPPAAPGCAPCARGSARSRGSGAGPGPALAPCPSVGQRRPALPPASRRSRAAPPRRPAPSRACPAPYLGPGASGRSGQALCPRGAAPPRCGQVPPRCLSQSTPEWPLGSRSGCAARPQIPRPSVSVQASASAPGVLSARPMARRSVAAGRTSGTLQARAPAPRRSAAGRSTPLGPRCQPLRAPLPCPGALRSPTVGPHPQAAPPRVVARSC
mmetsp:Transcript_7436/g.20904  ORF Transcript_7436/g.20904 Transcript_7436/m.20904 type:complete len:240 (-) Transcript_7436:888-1607(-)